ncbi:hypothetical protein MLD38_017526 [Melastoma candidum]|uniref:Uncharacterized protein n=1 Tax=Melastoma candidum TaxID=119954 RepID=A0ACB9QUZ2_9MYRT|nr:hypothetical protein MLD38_017526 [Melastoma candidum]
MEIDCGFSGSYYDVLGVGPYSSNEDIRRAYRKLAMKWHPERWTSQPSMFGEAKRNLQMVQQAYEVLSDDRKRLMYDAGVNDPNEAEEEEEGFSDFVQEMTSLMAQDRTEKKQDYSLEDLQGMLMEMAQGFDFPQWSDFEPPTTLSWPGPIKIGDGGGGASHHLEVASAGFRAY